MTPVFSTSAFPTCAPGPVTKFNTPGGQPRLLEHLDQHDRGQRRGRRGLEYQGVAANEGRGNLPSRNGDGEVPRSDDAHHAQRTLDGVGDRVRQLGRSRVPEHAAALAGGVLNDVHCPLDLAICVANGLALFGGDGPGYLVGPPPHDLQRPEKHAGPAGRRGVGPARQGRPGRFHRDCRVFGGGCLEFPHRLGLSGGVNTGYLRPEIDSTQSPPMKFL